MSYYLFEGPLPVKMFASTMSARAPHVCVTRDMLQYIVYKNIDHWDGRRLRYSYTFHNYTKYAFDLINKDFLHYDFFRVLIHENRLYIEVKYGVPSSGTYTGPSNVYTYDYSTASWRRLWYGRLTIERIKRYEKER